MAVREVCGKLLDAEARRSLETFEGSKFEQHRVDDWRIRRLCVDDSQGRTG
jgi:hypothetical protein